MFCVTITKTSLSVSLCPWMDHEISIPRFVDFIQLGITNRVEGEVRKTCSSYKQIDAFTALPKSKCVL
jgi:F0F1-type ATP synthase alpha subunit